MAMATLVGTEATSTKAANWCKRAAVDSTPKAARFLCFYPFIPPAI